jgi:leucyl aminopeptidase
VSLSIAVVEPGGPLAVATLGVLALAVEGEGAPRLLGPAVDGVPSELDAEECAREGFAAKTGQVLWVGAPGPRRVLAVGLGKAAGLEPERYRRAVAAFVRSARHQDAALLVPPEAPGSALAEGALLATYRFDAYRSSPPKTSALQRLVLVAPAGTSAALRESVAEGAAAADAVAFARDLVNAPPSDLDPEAFAARVVERMAGRPGVEVEVWDEQRIEAEHLGGLLTVARGSSRPPRVVMARYQPGVSAAVPHIVLVGKGITFDSGGLSLKTMAGMMTMKTDMSGAATVMAVVSALGELGVSVRVTAIAMVTENMPGPNAVKPGDVFRARNGLTVEVLNTDAEGRLVLADGLSLAAELEPDGIVDVATLTGAQVVALGRSIGALFGNDQELIDQLASAGRLAGEPLWPMPLPEDYAEDIDSEIADMKNMGRADREAGAIAAAMLLSRFVGDVRWGHLDIAGPARAGESSGYLVRGGTGFGVRALLGFLQARSA